jgi:hypothetical protein
MRQIRHPFKRRWGHYSMHKHATTRAKYSWYYHVEKNRNNVLNNAQLADCRARGVDLFSVASTALYKKQ